jgi:hypothetical protein
MYFQLRKKYVLDDCHYGYIKKIGKQICMEDFGLQKNEVNTSHYQHRGSSQDPNKINSSIPP